MADKKCKKRIRTEKRKGMAAADIRVICDRHGDIDKCRSPKDVESVWEKHLNDVKRGKV